MHLFNQQRFEAAYQVVQQTAQQGDRSAAQVHTPQVRLFDTVSSTNQVAWEWIDQGTSDVVVIALAQTAGRGQWGRQWQSAPGGLYLSAGLTPQLPVEQAAQLTLCTAWGMAIALRQIPSLLSGVEDFIPVQLKWLNDLVLNGHKLGGVLTETRVQQGRVTKAVVGVGLNWTNSTPETGINLKTFLEPLSTPLIESLEMLAAIALHGLITGYEYWQQYGIDSILLSYLELLAHRDRPVPIDGQLGTIVGIASTGELRVRLESPATPGIASLQNISWAEVLIQPGTISFGYPL